MLWHNFATGDLIVWRMNGTAAVGQSIVEGPKVTDRTWRVEGVEDFTGDGQLDILWRNYSTGRTESGWLQIWQMSGMNAVSTTRIMPDLTITDPTWRVEGTGDFNRG